MIFQLLKYDFVLSYASWINGGTQSRASIKKADRGISEADINAQVHMVYSGKANDADVSKIRHFMAEDGILS